MLNIGDTVKVHYTGKYMDDKVFDSTATSEAILFTIGDDMMIPAFEEAVMTMKAGEKKTIVLKAADAYGEYDDDLLLEFNRKDVFGEKEIKIGDIIQAPTEDGVMVFKVHKVDDAVVVLDGNLDMAGKDVKFDIELISIMKGSVDLFDDDNYDDDFDDTLEDLDVDDDCDIEQ